ncbi:MAG: sulfurtransferase [Candidatus Rokubacteria bacterium]|nr:sulfurtransferase [Candidatus Rokubacteria bacterium]
MSGSIHPDDLERLVRGTAPHALLDLRERATYERGHVYRATSLPRRLLELRLPALVPARRTPIAVYDDDGALAALAVPTLAAMGYTDVRVLDGGLASWRAARRRLVQGVNVPSKVFGERVLHELKTPEVRPAELMQRIERRDDMVIVDSRTPEEYARGCIPGAWSVPGGELVLRIAELLERPETTIVVHCGGRTRSYLGAESLRRMGLPNPIVALENGTMGWQLAGLELERGASRWAPAPSDKGRAVAARVAERVAAEDGIAFIEPAGLATLLARRGEENVYVLDVRTSEEYAGGHGAGAVWAPGGQAVQATDEYIAVRAAAIVLVCDGSGRSIITASWLRRMGLPDVRVLRGGLAAWSRSGGAVETGHPGPTAFGHDTARAAVRAVGAAPLRAQLAGAAPPVVLDVDPSDAYARGHVPGAAWICRSRLESRVAGLVPERGAVVVTCTDGIQSTLAAATLARLGHAASVLDGGKRAWEAAGGALERGATRLADETDDVVLKPYEKGRWAMEAYLRWEEALDDEGWSPHALLEPPAPGA